MFEFVGKLFDTTDFMPRWYCGDWTAGHGWLHIVSDLGVWLAYFTIPVILLYFALQRRDLPFRSVFLLFGAFILACGTTHLMEAAIFWWPAYRLAGVIKLVTAVVSWGTVFALVPTIPQALTLRSPRELEREIEERRRVEAELRQLHGELEQRVAERTAELAAANDQLKAEIRQRQRTEEALRDQREWLRVTLRSIGDAVVATDTQGRVTLLNEVAQSLTGWSESEARGRPLDEVFQVLNEQTRERGENPAERALREGTIVTLASDTLLVSRDGTECPIDDSAAPIRNQNGEIAGSVLVFREVSERRRAEQAAAFLADVSAELASVIDVQSTLEKLARLTVPFFADWCAVDLLQGDGSLKRLAVAHVDPHKVDRARRLRERLQVVGGRDLGRQALDSGVPQLIEVTDEVLQSLVQDDDYLEELRSLRLKSALHVPLIVRGRPFGVITFVTSESGRVYQQRDVALATDLAQRAAAAIDNAELYRELREADIRKDEFLAMLGHELRNPLAPIRSGLELLEADQPGDEMLQLMKEQVEHMVRLVDDLLDVSRIMRGKIELKLTSVDLLATVRRTVEAMQPTLDAHRHRVRVSLPDEPITLEADPVRLSQVLVNLLQNAAKYTEPEGEIEVSVTRSGGHAVLRVADNGIGIEAELLPRVFDLFTQADRSVERSRGGLGIGLTLVRSLVEMHGGTVDARSPGLDQGSEFVIRLPIRSAGLLETAEMSEPATVPPRRVLVVDDNTGAAKMLGMTLTKVWGHQVELAHDGLEAISLAKKQCPEVILLDIGLPGMSGYEVARRLRNDDHARDVLLVALTGYGQEEDRRRSFESGFDEHLVKPVSMTRLRSLFMHPKLAPGA